MIRNILYGYKYVNGEIVFHPQEIVIMQEIFKMYIDGKSLLEIAKNLNERQIEYMPHVVGWNKSRIMRLLEDKRYLGESGYPSIIDQDTYDAIQIMKTSKCEAQRFNRRADIFQINIPVKCSKCNGFMKRKTDDRRKKTTWWKCQNSECRVCIAKRDEDLLSEITEILNNAIVHWETISILMEKEKEPSLEMLRIDNEISRALSGVQIDREEVKAKILRYGSLKYRSYDSVISKAQVLKDVFKNTQPSTVFSAGLLKKTTDEIRLYEDGMIGLVLENGQEIKKEEQDANKHVN